MYYRYIYHYSCLFRKLRLFELRVLIVSEHFFPIVGGSTTYVHNLCKNLSTLGCEVYLVTIPDDRNPVMEWYKEDGFYIYRLKIPKIFRTERYFPLFLFLNLNKISCYVNPDIIHFAYGLFAPIVTRFKKIDKPIIWTIHNLPPDEHHLDKLYTIKILHEYLEKLYFNITNLYGGLVLKTLKYNILICNSEKTAKLVIGKGIAPHKITTIPVGVDIDIFNPVENYYKIKEELGLDYYKKIITTVAGIIEHKGQDYLIQSIPCVLKTYPDTLFLVIGPIRSEIFYGKLDELIENLCVKKNIKFISGLETTELHKYYAISDVYVQPSLEEGFCISILEAMACGKPVIGTKTGAIPMFIQESGGGILIDSKSPQQICTAITTMLLNPHKAIEMGRQARSYAVEKYSWIKIAEHTLNLYNIVKVNEQKN